MDFNYLHEYAEETAQELSAKFFHDKFIIEGSALMGFCSVKQVNLFVLKTLFEEWEKDTSRLKSPFFDFDNQYVKDALTEFMEKLSFHIRIEQKDFMPLLQCAIEETILLVLNPAQYLRSIIIDPNDEFVHLKSIRSQAKYTKLNGHVLQGIVANMEEKNKDSMLVEELSPVLENLLQDETNNYNHEDFLEEINDLYPLDVVRLLGQEETIGLVTSPLNEQLVPSEEGSSINESLAVSEELSLKDQLNTEKITSLKTAFGLNQRYLFINKLFQGNEMLFSEAINKIDQQGNYEEAVNYLLESYSEEFNWGDEENTVAELFGIIDRRF
jgi:hypothetical protein